MSGYEDLLFSATLTPRRSSTRRHRNTAVILFAVASVPVGVAFAIIGAWPASVFIGADIALLAALLHYHHFAGRMRETIELRREALKVERRDHWGRRKIWMFEPQLLHVHLEELDEHRNNLELRTRDSGCSIGGFLSPEEKAGLAAALREKLARVSVLYAP